MPKMGSEFCLAVQSLTVGRRARMSRSGMMVILLFSVCSADDHFIYQRTALLSMVTLGGCPMQCVIIN
jgi:hypothetical protein